MNRRCSHAGCGQSRDRQLVCDAMDLVGEFQRLDQTKDTRAGVTECESLLDTYSAEQRDSHSIARSIGGADLSGILDVDDEDHSAVSPATDSGRPSASFLQEAGMNLAQGDQLAMEGARQAGGRAPLWQREPVPGGSRVLAIEETIEGDNKLTSASIAQSLTCSPAGGGGDDGDGRVGWDDITSTSSITNMSSPARPVEECSDWDDIEKSSGSFFDVESDRMQEAPLEREAPAPDGVKFDSKDPGDAASADHSTQTPKRIIGSATAKPLPGDTPSTTSDTHAASCGTIGNDRRREGNTPGSARADMGNRKTPVPGKIEGRGRSYAHDASLEKAAKSTAILQIELQALREHVTRSEQRQELRLRELEARLAAQETRNTGRDLPEGGGMRGARHDGASESKGDSATSKEMPGANGEGRSPEGTSGHNPFAASTGGAATPREHFPAFEDALQASEESPTHSENAGHGEVPEPENSLVHNEAFEFSIDTLSHINNHTDFGTDIPTTTTPPARTAVSPNIVSGRKTRGTSMPSQRPRRTGEDDDGGEEGFDEKDAAAEDAFFADAGATASLQTPVKHLLAAAGADRAVAARRAKPDARLARGTPAVRIGTEGPPPRGSKPLQSWSAERMPETDAGVSLAAQAESTHAHGRSPRYERGDLCMADFFARASAELECAASRETDRLGDSSGSSADIGDNRDAGTCSSPGSRRVRSRGVDVATQTSCTLASGECGRFASSGAHAHLLASADGKAKGTEGSTITSQERANGGYARGAREQRAPKSFGAHVGRGASNDLAQFFRDTPAGKSGDRDDGGSDGPGARLRRQRQRPAGHSLSPILSDGGTSASSAGAGGNILPSFRSCPSGEAQGILHPLSRQVADVVVSDSADSVASGHRTRQCPAEATCGDGEGLVASRVTVERSTGCNTTASESSVDVTRSSVLRASTRASTTLETIAQLDDSMGRSFSFQSRPGAPMPGELFADAREHCSRRVNSLFGCGECLRRWDDQRRSRTSEFRSRSFPSLPTERMSAGSPDEGSRTPAERSREIPPALAWSWLAVAIEKMYDHEYGECDKNVGRPRALELSPMMGRQSPTVHASVANEVQSSASQPQAAEVCAFTQGPLESPPPPPPPPRPFHLGAEFGDDEDAGNEETLFHQRQRLLQRVISAAARHGGVSRFTQNSVVAPSSSGGQEYSGHGQGSRDALGCSFSRRRHSDPMSWKTPSSATAGKQFPLSGAAPSSAARGTPSYRWRQTSGYWRDRLGMTQ